MSEQRAAQARRPNLIWIFGDQHRGQALSCMGDPNVSTPNLDRMAGDGLASTAAVAGFPLCCPFRGSLVTSRYPHQCVPGHEFPLPPEMPTVADAFRDAGYHTAYFGKWHLAGFKEREGRTAMRVIPPERRGHFDHWVGYENNNAQWDCWVHGDGPGNQTPRRLPGYETDCLTDLLIDHLRSRTAGESAAQPFFAALSVQPPHDPYLAPAEFMARHTPASLQLRPNVPAVPRIIERARRELAGAYAQIENLDWNVGRVMAALTELGLADDTIVLFFSDHGDMHGSHGQFRKTSPWAESVNIPFIIWGGGSRYDHRTGFAPLPVNHVDIAPTSLGLCGIRPPDWMAGADCSHCYRRGAAGTTPDSAYLQSVVPTGHGQSIDRPWRGVVTADGWKYVCLEGQPWMLFNLNEDPCEQVNLAYNTAYAAERRRLQDRLAGWVADTSDTFALPEA
ncbi:MAG: Arylsulfatase [Phycisphaerae bacterium]|nr:Arylsulfatase [Phycisphaerae bacterium]